MLNKTKIKQGLAKRKPTQKERLVQVTVRLDQRDYDHLVQEALKERRSLGANISKVLNAYVSAKLLEAAGIVV